MDLGNLVRAADELVGFEEVAGIAGRVLDIEDPGKESAEAEREQLIRGHELNIQRLVIDNDQTIDPIGLAVGHLLPAGHAAEEETGEECHLVGRFGHPLPSCLDLGGGQGAAVRPDGAGVDVQRVGRGVLVRLVALDDFRGYRAVGKAGQWRRILESSHDDAESRIHRSKLYGRADTGHTQVQCLLVRSADSLLHDRLRDASGNSHAGRARGQAAEESTS